MFIVIMEAMSCIDKYSSPNVANKGYHWSRNLRRRSIIITGVPVLSNV